MAGDGLSAAIDAAELAFDDVVRVNEPTRSEMQRGIEAAVRAAAPHIRRAALEKAANDVDAVAESLYDRGIDSTTVGIVQFAACRLRDRTAEGSTP